jgi:hypothetical protein
LRRRSRSTVTNKEQEAIMGINTPKPNRNDRTTADQALADGLTRNAATVPSIMIGGVSVPAKEVVAALQARIGTAKAVISARATWQVAVQADRDERAKTKTIVSVTKATLLAAFAGQVDKLATFGLTPRKPRVVSPGAQVAAAAKAKATRAARHTLGKKQKAGIKGTATVPAAPVAAPTPAPTQPATAAPTPPQAPTQSPPPPSPATPVTTTAPTHGS